MSNDVLLGALLSIPIGIATGVAVIPIQKWIESRGKQKALIQAREAKERYLSILFYRLHPHLFTQYLLHTVIRTTFVAAAVGIISGVVYAVAQVAPNFLFIDIRNILFFVGQLTAIVSSVLIIGYCRPALMLWQQVRNFEEYVKSVPGDIRDLAAEGEAEKLKQGVL